MQKFKGRELNIILPIRKQCGRAQSSHRAAHDVARGETGSAARHEERTHPVRVRALLLLVELSVHPKRRTRHAPEPRLPDGFAGPQWRTPDAACAGSLHARAPASPPLRLWLSD